jgi:serine phosphatase RsbU (regulator of sigma subunit)
MSSTRPRDRGSDSPAPDDSGARDRGTGDLETGDFDSGDLDRARDVERALWNAHPHRLLATAHDVIKRYTGAAEMDILLADYHQAHLMPALPGGEPVPLDNTFQGRAFASQRPVRDGNTPPSVHLPLTVHGERLGVLTLQEPPAALAPPDAGSAPHGDLGGPHGAPGGQRGNLGGLRGDLEELAHVLARALHLADAGTDLYRRIRRRTRLTLAAEMQWDLLPGRACDTAEFRLAGQLEPAYAVWGDNFDWAVAEDRLTLTVSNGMGSGTESAALTHLAISALRNARRSGGDITEQAALADQTLYAQHRGARHLATLLLDFELATGRVRAIDAGSPRIFRMRAGGTEMISFEAQLPLGMFGDAHYTTEEFTLDPGDRLVVVSDGVHTAESPEGEIYGAVALAQALRDTRLQNPTEAVRSFIRRFIAYHRGTALADDAVVVCLDWLGRGTAN